MPPSPACRTRELGGAWVDSARRRALACLPLQQGLAGQVYKVVVQNFMCHEHLAVELG